MDQGGAGVSTAGPASGPPGWQQTVQAAQNQGVTNTSSVNQASSGIWNSVTNGKGVYGLMQNQGLMGMVNGFMQGAANASMINDQQKWQSQHAPGQTSGKPNYGAGYGDASKWQGNNSGGNAGSAANSAQSSGLANTSDSANQAMTAASTPFGAATTSPNQAPAPVGATVTQQNQQAQNPVATVAAQQQKGLLNYMQRVPSFLEGPYGD